MRLYQLNVFRLCLLVLLVLTVLTLGTQTTRAQESDPQEEAEVTEPEIPQDSLGRRTPRGSMLGFINALGERNYSRASRFLNLDSRFQGDLEEEQLAENFQRLLDAQGNILPYSVISDEYDGRIDDDLPPGKDRVGSLHADGETIDLILEQVEEEEAAIWLISEETVRSIAAVDVDDALMIERIAPGFLENTFWFGVPLAHWITFLLIAVAAYFGSWIII